MNSQSAESAKYCPHVDGLRAVGVLSVLFFHAGFGCPGGYVGVDVFFVISGYLITGLILREIDAGRFSILGFWERRIRRILPALFVVVLACSVAAWFLFVPLDFKQFAESAFAQAALASNVFFWWRWGYFNPAAEAKPLLHTWSLGVEEQFYLLFPFLLVALNRVARRLLVPAILLLGSASLALSIYCSYAYPSFNFYLLPTRSWELLTGSLLAARTVQHAFRKWARELLSVAGVTAVLCAIFLYDRETRFPGLAALLPCGGAALVIWTNDRALTFVGRILAARPAVFIGLISYSLYLWHWPMLVFYRYYLAPYPVPNGQRALLLLAATLVACASWRYVETPFRRRTVAKGRLQIFALAGMATAIMLCGGLAVHKLQGIPSRMPATALRFAQGTTDMPFWISLSSNQAAAGDYIELGERGQHRPIELLVWGDSHGMAAMPVFDFLCKQHAIRGIAATRWITAPLVGYENTLDHSQEGTLFSNAVIDFIRSHHHRHVILVARWHVYANYSGVARFRQALFNTVNTLSDAGARVWIMTEVPEPGFEVPRILAQAAWRGADLEDLAGLPARNPVNYLTVNSIFEELAATHSGVTVLNPTQFLVDGSGRCRIAKNGRALYADGQHLTTAGAMLLRPIFEPIFSDMLRNAAPPANEHPLLK